MEKEHRHLDLHHAHPAEGDHIDHEHGVPAPPWMGLQRSLHDQLVAKPEVQWRYIFGADGYFFGSRDYFFAALSRKGPELEVWLRLTGNQRGLAKELPYVTDHPMLRGDWVAATVKTETERDEIRKWLDRAYEAATQGDGRTIEVPGAKAYLEYVAAHGSSNT